MMWEGKRNPNRKETKRRPQKRNRNKTNNVIVLEVHLPSFYPPKKDSDKKGFLEIKKRKRGKKGQSYNRKRKTETDQPKIRAREQDTENLLCWDRDTAFPPSMNNNYNMP